MCRRDHEKIINLYTDECVNHTYIKQNSVKCLTLHLIDPLSARIPDITCSRQHVLQISRAAFMTLTLSLTSSVAHPLMISSFKRSLSLYFYHHVVQENLWHNISRFEGASCVMSKMACSRIMAESFVKIRKPPFGCDYLQNSLAAYGVYLA